MLLYLSLYTLNCWGVFVELEVVCVQGSKFPLILSPCQVGLHAGKIKWTFLKPVLHFLCYPIPRISRMRFWLFPCPWYCGSLIDEGITNDSCYIQSKSIYFMSRKSNDWERLQIHSGRILFPSVQYWSKPNSYDDVVTLIP